MIGSIYLNRKKSRAVRSGISRITAVMMILAALLLQLSLCVFAAETEEKSESVYTAFGDSIAYGYGLDRPTEDGYVARVGQMLGAETYNFGINGQTSRELLDYLQTDEFSENTLSGAAVRTADVITVSIGSNDLLGAMTQGIADIISELIIEPDTEITEQIFKTSLSLLMQDRAFTDRTDRAIADYKGIVTDIYKTLRGYGPDAEIVFVNLYNPYVGATFSEIDLDLDGYADALIVRMNGQLQAAAEENGFSVADAYTGMNEEHLTNYDISRLNLDPHPNLKGHETIASAVRSALERDGIDVTGTEAEDAFAAGAEPQTEEVTDTEEAVTYAVDPVALEIENKQQLSGRVAIYVIAAMVAALLLIMYLCVVLRKNKNKK